MGRGGPDTSSDKSRGKDPSVDPTAPTGHRGPITQDPKRPPDLNSPYTSEQTVKINGQEVPTGYTEYGFDEQGNPTVKFIPYTRQQLEAAAAQKAAEQQPGVKVRGASPTNPKASAPPPKASTSPYNPNANAPAASGSPWDNVASGTSADYSKSKIVTGYQPTTDLAAAGGGGASSYSGIYKDSAPNGVSTNSDTLENLLKNFANSGPDEIKKVQQQLQTAGLGSGINVTGIADASTIAAYRGLLQNALLLQSGGQQITPEDLLAGLAKSAKSKTTTTSDVTLTNPVQAHQALLTAFSDKLGRKPTAGEALAFTSALHAYETANPTTASTTTDASGQTVTSQKTTDKGTGSLNFVNDFATNYAQTDPGTSGEYHAAQALDFYNLALSSLANSPVSTGNPD